MQLFMLLEAADFSEKDWETVYRSWVLYGSSERYDFFHYL